jgi:hypothetical protein
MRDLMNLILQIQNTTNQCLMLGVYQGSFSGSIVTKSMLEQNNYIEDVKTRTQSMVSWNTQSMLFFDYDFTPVLKDSMKAENFKELYQLIIKVLPEFKNVEMLFKFSSSSNIYDVHQYQFVSQKIGMHVYFMVDNANDKTVANFKAMLLNRLTDMELFQVIDGKTEYLFDESVFSQEREIIETKPILPSNLAVHEVGNEMKIFNEGGQVFDLSTVPESNMPTTSNTYVDNSHLSADTNTRLNYLTITVSKPRADYKKVLAFLNGQIVNTILSTIGYAVYSNKFKLRNEKTASASVKHDDGFIKDFGGSFKGSILSLLTEYHGLSFKQAKDYLYVCFGANNLKIDGAYGDLVSPYEINQKLYANVTLNMDIEVPDVKVFKGQQKQQQEQKTSYDLQEVGSSIIDGMIERASYDELQKVFKGIELDQYKQNIDSLYPLVYEESTNVALGYSREYKSLAVVLLEEGKFQSISIRRNNNVDNKETWEKWKKYGTINYIPNKIKKDDKNVYIAFGMMEIVLFEVLGVSYMVFQSDAVAKEFNKSTQVTDLVMKTLNKNIIIYCDNDESCKDAVTHLQTCFTNAKSLEVLHFEHVLAQELKKGYDLIDYVNEHGLDIINFKG